MAIIRHHINNKPLTGLFFNLKLSTTEAVKLYEVLNVLRSDKTADVLASLKDELNNAGIKT